MDLLVVESVIGAIGYTLEGTQVSRPESRFDTKLVPTSTSSLQ